MASKKQKDAAFNLIVLVLVLCVFAIHARSLNFTQDDAFIIYRYAKNFANGNGFVFNVGERVEGYTSFSWTFLMAQVIRMGLDPITVSKILGFLSSLGSILLLFFISNLISKKRFFLFNTLACIMIVGNGSFAMWTMSGMETALFIFLVLCGVYCYLFEHYRERYGLLTPVVFVLASLTRPEGMFLFGLTFAHRLAYSLVTKRFQLRSHLQWLGLYGILLLPFFLWRLSYYGYPFPNTFYAKTGFSLVYIEMGFEYTVTFLRQYAVWGLAFVVPFLVLFFRRERFWFGYCVLLILALMMYVTLIGGDVLLENRFYIPVFFLMYLIVQETLYDVYLLFQRKNYLKNVIVQSAVVTCIVVFAVLYSLWTYSYPRGSILASKKLMEEVVSKFSRIAKWINEQGTQQASLATTGVGAVSYYSNIQVIDMYGMTDDYIAHNPEGIEGLTSTTKEQNYNISYIMSRKPTYIYFVTNMKPSALAEKALFTSPEFRQGYYTYWLDDNHLIYRRKNTYTPKHEEYSTYTSVEFINEYCSGLNNKDSNPEKAVEQFEKAIELGPKDFGYPYEQIGLCYVNYLSDYEKAFQYCTKAIEIDDYCALAHAALGAVSVSRGDIMNAQKELKKTLSLWPDYSSAHYYLGKTLAAMQQFDEAIKEFQTAIQLDKYFYLAYMDLGILCNDYLNKPQTALKYLEYFLRKYPEGKETKVVRQKIKEIKETL